MKNNRRLKAKRTERVKLKIVIIKRLRAMRNVLQYCEPTTIQLRTKIRERIINSANLNHLKQ